MIFRRFAYENLAALFSWLGLLVALLLAAATLLILRVIWRSRGEYTAGETLTSLGFALLSASLAVLVFLASRRP